MEMMIYEPFNSHHLLGIVRREQTDGSLPPGDDFAQGQSWKPATDISDASKRGSWEVTRHLLSANLSAAFGL